MGQRPASSHEFRLLQFIAQHDPRTVELMERARAALAPLERIR